MRTIKALTTLVALWAISAVCHAQTFIRPSVSYIHFQDSHYSDKAGVGVDFGCALDDMESHELSLGVDYSSWSYRKVPVPALLGAPVVVANGKLLPVLVNYRLKFGGRAGSRTTFYVGPSIGFTRVQGSMDYSLSGVRYIGSYSKWAPSFGLSLGASWKLQDRLSFELGYRFLRINSVDASLPLLGNPGAVTYTHSLGTTSTHGLQLALRFSL